MEAERCFFARSRRSAQKKIDVAVERGRITVIFREKFAFIHFQDDREFDGRDKLQAFQLDVPPVRQAASPTACVNFGQHCS